MNTATTPLGSAMSVVGEMLGAPKAGQRERGYADTLAEICQQPEALERTLPFRVK